VEHHLRHSPTARTHPHGWPARIDPQRDDFGVNAAALHHRDDHQRFSASTQRNPEFVRAVSHAVRYHIDEFAEIMKRGNNGGYANNWL